MPTPGEHKTVQARILAYAEAIGWTVLSRQEAEQRRGFDPTAGDAPPSAECARNRSLFFDDLLDAKLREFNEVTEELAFHYGHYGTREDVVFLINGIPMLVIECKNADKQEAIALGVDQIRRYHQETPEMFISQQLFTATDAIGFSYGVSWNTVRRNLFSWKHEQIGQLEAKIQSFCAIPQLLAFLQHYILCAEKDDLEVEFALKSKANPIGVAEYQLKTTLPKELQGKLSSAEELGQAIGLPAKATPKRRSAP